MRTEDGENDPFQPGTATAVPEWCAWALDGADKITLKMKGMKLTLTKITFKMKKEWNWPSPITFEMKKEWKWRSTKLFWKWKDWNWPSPITLKVKRMKLTLSKRRPRHPCSWVASVEVEVVGLAVGAKQIKPSSFFRYSASAGCSHLVGFGEI